MTSKELTLPTFFFFGNLGRVDNFWTYVNLMDRRPHFQGQADAPDQANSHKIPLIHS